MPATFAPILNLRRYGLREKNSQLLATRRARLRFVQSREALRRLTYDVSQTARAENSTPRWLKAMWTFSWPIEIPGIAQVTTLNSLLGYFRLQTQRTGRHKRDITNPPLLTRIVTVGPSALLPDLLRLVRKCARSIAATLVVPTVGRWYGIATEGIKAFGGLARHWLSTIL